MIVNTRKLTESLEKKYKLNESFVEEWWGQTEEDPYDFAEEYGLDIEPIKSKFDSTLFRFSGPKENIDNAVNDGYFYTMSMGYEDPNMGERHSEDLDEAWEEEFDDEYDAIMDDDSLSEEEKTEKINLLHQKYNKKNESLNEGVDDQDFQWFVGDSESGYMYPDEHSSLNVVKKLIDDARNTEGCEIISIVVTPQDSWGNDLQ